MPALMPCTIHHHRIADYHQPPKRIAELGPSLAVGRYAAWIIIGRPGNQAGTERPKQASGLPAEGGLTIRYRGFSGRLLFHRDESGYRGRLRRGSSRFRAIVFISPIASRFSLVDGTNMRRASGMPASRRCRSMVV
jgi:hypothetical protein